jgi:hypothetical protein
VTRGKVECCAIDAVFNGGELASDAGVLLAP